MRLTLNGKPIGQRYFTRAQAIAAYIRLSRCIQGLGVEDGCGSGNSVESKQDKD